MIIDRAECHSTRASFRVLSVTGPEVGLLINQSESPSTLYSTVADPPDLMQGHRRRRETKRSPVTPIRPKGWDGTGPSFYGSSSPMSRHRLVVPPRDGLIALPTNVIVFMKVSTVSPVSDVEKSPVPVLRQGKLYRIDNGRGDDAFYIAVLGRCLGGFYPWSCGHG